jgi:HSP20 family molecular chaperone IbpA
VAAHPSGETHEPGHFHWVERAFGRFERCIPLPTNIDATRQKSPNDGVVTVIVPKTRAIPPTQLSDE